MLGTGQRRDHAEVEGELIGKYEVFADRPGISAYWMFADLNTQPAFVQMLHVEP